jgi:hypothetical protein
VFASTEQGELFHKGYVTGELRQKKQLKQQLNELFEQARSQENKQLADSLSVVQVQLRLVREENSNLNATIISLKKDSSELKEKLKHTLEQLSLSSRDL